MTKTKRKCLLALFSSVLLALTYQSTQAQYPSGIFLPLVMKQEVPTPTPGPTPGYTARTGNVQITTIVYNFPGTVQPGEYVEIINREALHVQLEGWRLSDIASHTFTFPSFNMQPGQVCRIYTNEYHPETCGFSFGNNLSIWNNGGDTATLRDYYGTVVSQYSY